MHGNFTLVAIAAVLLLPLDILFISIDRADAIRFSKENKKTQSLCESNITITAEQQKSFQYPRCVALNSAQCLDIKLPYNSTYLPQNLPDLSLGSFEEVKNYLQRWNGVRKLPKCWPVLQVALCSLLMPQCDEVFQPDRLLRVHRSNVDICNDLVNRPECEFIDSQLDWPSIFNCNDTNLYAKNCTNELRDFKYSNLGHQSVCQYPLVATNQESSWFRNVRGCALHCKFPISSKIDQSNISLFIKVLTFFGLSYMIATMILFKANHARSRHSRIDKVLKRCILCQFILYIGWSLQLFLNEDVACDNDGSILYGQPLVASPCVLSFLLTYMPSLSNLFWCAYFGRLIYEHLEKQKGDNKSPNRTKLDPTLSLINHGVPMALFLCVAFLGHIDGHGLYGICTVGQQSVLIKTLFIFVPRALVAIYCNYYYFMIIYKLISVKKLHLRRINMRVSAQAIITIMQAVFPILNHFYESVNRSRWQDSIERYVSCNLNLPIVYLAESVVETVNQQADCQLDTKPIVTFYYAELFAELSLGIVISSWLFKEKNLRGLRKTLIHLLEDDEYKEWRANVCAAEGNEIAMAEETLHDLVDITSGAKAPRDNTELVAAKGGRLSTWIAQGQQRLASRLPSVTSLNSRTSLASTFLNLDTRHNNNSNKTSEKRSRDIVEDMRSRKQVVGPPIDEVALNACANLAALQSHPMLLQQVNYMQTVRLYCEANGEFFKPPTAMNRSHYISVNDPYMDLVQD